MILEQLISAYLDGDLTIEQDRELRERMRTDPAAREAFDSAVLIHIAMRCEDESAPPLERRAAIFDAVEAIAAEDRALAMRPSIRQPRTLRLAATALVAIMALWLPISDGVIPVASLDPSLIGLSTPQPLEREVVAVEDPGPTRQLSAHRGVGGQVVMQQEVTVGNDAAVNVDPVSEPHGPALGEGGSATVTLGALFQGVVHPALASDAQAPSRSETSTAPTEIIPWRDDEPVSVTVATAYAAGMGSTIASAQNVEQVSASLAYGLTDADAVGLEIGSTSYSIQQTSAMLTTTEPVSSSMRTVVHGGDGGGKLASPEDEPTQFTTSTVDRNAQVRSMWGTAFYERRLLELESVALFGRAGAGVSQEGILGFGRITGQWTVAGGVSLVVGAEARSMPFQTGAGTRAASQISYGAIVTAVTGLQVRF